MNTGTIETNNLYLVPSSARDNEPFVRMLREDGNFKDFCGIDFSEKFLCEFRNYYTRSDQKQCMYSLFTKKQQNEFIGHVGLHWDDGYEIEFYVSKKCRKKGYCEEACRKLIALIFSEGISIDGKQFCVDKIYATTLPDNTAVHGLLKKLGFKRDVSEDGKILLVEGLVDEENDKFIGCFVSRYVLEKGREDCGS